MVQFIASGICDGDNFRRLVSTKRPKHEKKDRPPLEAQSNWKSDYTRKTSRDVSPSSRSSAVSPLVSPLGPKVYA